MSTPAEMTRAAFARFRGVDKSYITRLAKAGRLVLTDDKKRVRVQESLKLLADTEDPSKVGVKERFADQRGERLAEELALENTDTTPASVTAAPAPSPAKGDGAGGEGSMMEDRRALIQEQAAAARLKRLELEGRLVDKDQVYNATFEKTRVARNALMGMVDVIAPRLAAETNAARVHDILSAEVRRVCEELAAGETDATRQ